MSESDGSAERWRSVCESVAAQVSCDWSGNFGITYDWSGNFGQVPGRVGLQLHPHSVQICQEATTQVQVSIKRVVHVGMPNHFSSFLQIFWYKESVSAHLMLSHLGI